MPLPRIELGPSETEPSLTRLLVRYVIGDQVYARSMLFRNEFYAHGVTAALLAHGPVETVAEANEVLAALSLSMGYE